MVHKINSILGKDSFCGFHFPRRLFSRVSQSTSSMSFGFNLIPNVLPDDFVVLCIVVVGSMVVVVVSTVVVSVVSING